MQISSRWIYLICCFYRTHVAAANPAGFLRLPLMNRFYPTTLTTNYIPLKQSTLFHLRLDLTRSWFLCKLFKRCKPLPVQSLTFHRHLSSQSRRLRKDEVFSHLSLLWLNKMAGMNDPEWATILVGLDPSAYMCAGPVRRMRQFSFCWVIISQH